MNRIIKFRALFKNKEKSRWIYYGTDELLPVDDGEWDVIVVRDSQFTGQKDKDGIALYEGDIVAYSSSRKKDGSLSKSSLRVITLPYYRKVKKPAALELIGNIWENPELLNGN
jgi:hypothetical protein